MENYPVFTGHINSGPQIQTSFPPIFGYEGLSLLMGRSVATLQADKCRHPESLPPDCTPPGTRNPLWLLTDVLDWLGQFRRQPVEVKPQPPKPPKLRTKGAPTKTERVEAARLGISVHELRSRQEGGAK